MVNQKAISYMIHQKIFHEFFNMNNRTLQLKNKSYMNTGKLIYLLISL